MYVLYTNTCIHMQYMQPYFPISSLQCAPTAASKKQGSLGTPRTEFRYDVWRPKVVKGSRFGCSSARVLGESFLYIYLLYVWLTASGGTLFEASFMVRWEWGWKTIHRTIHRTIHVIPHFTCETTILMVSVCFSDQQSTPINHKLVPV